METGTRDVKNTVQWYLDGAILHCEMVHRLHMLVAGMYDTPEYHEARAVQVAEQEAWLEEEWGWM